VTPSGVQFSRLRLDRALIPRTVDNGVNRRRVVYQIGAQASHKALWFSGVIDKPTIYESSG
jgi:hypothetical protein